MTTKTIVVNLAAASSSSGQAVGFETEYVPDCVIENTAGVDIQYSLNSGGWTTIAAGASATLDVDNPGLFRLRKAVGSSYPVPVKVTWPTDRRMAVFKTANGVVADSQGGDSSPAYGVSRSAYIASIIAAAARRNSVIAEPWSKAPTHAFSTAYFAGGAVRGQGADAENLYLCVQSGTTGAASAPTGTGVAGMADGTCAWLYMGKGSATSTYPLRSTVTPTGPSDVMNGMIAFPNTGTASTLGLTNQYVMTYANTPVRVSGGNALINDGGYIDIQGPLTGTLASGTRSSPVERHLIHFMTDCRNWLFIQQAGAPLYPGKRYIEIDGRPITEGDVGIGSTINPGGILINMARFGPGVHEVKIRNNDRPLSTAFYLTVGADEQIWPAAPNELTVAFEGDSITQSSGTAAYAAGYSLNRLVSDMLGASSDYNNAIGGTGAIANNSNNATTYIQRLSDIAAIQPDILVIGGFHNDSSYTSAQRQAAFLEYLRAVRAACPNTAVFLTGNQVLAGDSLVSGAGTTQYDAEVDAQAAFTAWGDANSKFVPLLTHPQKFPANNGTNSWFFQSAGSAPFNDGHPVPRYYPSIAARIVGAIREFYSV